MRSPGTNNDDNQAVATIQFQVEEAKYGDEFDPGAMNMLVPAEILGSSEEAATTEASSDVTHAAATRNVEVKVFALKNVRAADADRILEQFYVGTGREAIAASIAVEERTNSIIARGDAAVLSEIEALLLRLDSETPKDDGNATVRFEGNVEKGKGFSGYVPALEKGSDSRTFRLMMGAEREAERDLRQTLELLEQKTRELSEQLRRPVPDPVTGDKLKTQLRDAVGKAFEIRQKLQRAELAEFAQRLQGIQQSIEMRDRIAGQIIDRRVSELLDPNLKWEEATQDVSIDDENGKTEF